jgi:hypothetical protein
MIQPYASYNDFQDIRIFLDKRNAYHQAGHAAAIYLGNKQKKLPAVHFQIIIRQQENDVQHSDPPMPLQDKCAAKVEGGRLIQSLPVSYAELAQGFTWPQQEEFRCALEADVINILVGSLAEAKYVAIQDDEVFNANLVNIAALHFYNGKQDIDIISEYMECLLQDKTERNRKLDTLFLAAYNFVNKRTNWLAITALAEFIREKNNGIIQCEEVISLLDFRLAV